MSAFAALHASSMALMTQSHVMERISGNVTNINTTGYKAFDAHLRDSINHVTPLGNHFTVSSVDVRHAEAQGLVLSSGRGLDLAINGQGYFITNPAFDGSGTQHFTRNGATSSLLGDDGNAYLGTTGGQFFQGWAADAEGTIDTTGPLVPIQLDSVEGLPGEPTTQVSFRGNVEASTTESHTFEVRVWSTPDAEGVNEPYSLEMTWTPGEIGTNTWTVSYGVRAPDGTVTDLTDTTPVAFNGDGTYNSPAEAPVVTVPFADGGSTDVTVDLSGMTQYGETGFLERGQDVNGFQEGRVAGVSFDEFGRLSATYSNGQSRILYQLALADFPAPQNLADEGTSMFTRTDAAGEPLIFGIDNAFSRTAIVPGALESSTVDLASEFSRMITTQKAYSMSATVYRTSDEMIRGAAELKR